MKPLLFRVLLVVGVGFVPCCPDGYGKPPQAPPVRAVALVPEKDCGCTVGAPCICGPDCTCGSARLVSHTRPPQAPPERPGPVEWTIYRLAYERAIQQNRPLLIWVGEICPSCETSWSEYVHARLSEYDGPPYESQAYKGPGVIVARPDGMGGMSRAGTLGGIPVRSEVQALLGLRRATPLTFAPPPMPMPMMPMMGGFGGFGGGGGCGGGG